MAEIQFSTPNQEKGRSAPIGGVIVHATRSGIAGNNDWISTINHFANPESEASSHLLGGRDGRLGRFVRDRDTAWHAGYHNPSTLGIELEQPTEATPFTTAQLVSAAAAVRFWCVRWEIRMARVIGSAVGGIVGHEDTPQGRAIGKTDPGYLFPWARFISMVSQEDEMWYRLNGKAEWWTNRPLPNGWAGEMKVNIDFPALPADATSIELEVFLAPEGGGTLVLHDHDRAGPYAGQVNARDPHGIIRVQPSQYHTVGIEITGSAVRIALIGLVGYWK